MVGWIKNEKNNDGWMDGFKNLKKYGWLDGLKK